MKKASWPKPLAIFSSFLMLITVCLSPLSQTAFAQDKDELTIEDVHNVIAKGIQKEGSEYVLNEKIAKENGFTEQHIKNLEEFLSKESNSTIEQAINYSKGSDATAFAAGGKVMGFFKTTLAVFVGATLAQTVVSHAIDHGIQSACNKFQDTWGVTNSCKIVGYPPE